MLSSTYIEVDLLCVCHSSKYKKWKQRKSYKWQSKIFISIQCSDGCCHREVRWLTVCLRTVWPRKTSSCHEHEMSTSHRIKCQHLQHIRRTHTAARTIFGLCSLFRFTLINSSIIITDRSLSTGRSSASKPSYLSVFRLSLHLCIRPLHKVVNHTHHRSSSSSPTLYSCLYHHLHQVFTLYISQAFISLMHQKLINIRL